MSRDSKSLPKIESVLIQGKLARRRLAFVGTKGPERGAQEKKMLRGGFWGGRRLPATARTAVPMKGRALCAVPPSNIPPKLHTPFRKGKLALLQSSRAERTEFQGYKMGKPGHQRRPHRGPGAHPKPQGRGSALLSWDPAVAPGLLSPPGLPVHPEQEPASARQ